MKKFDKKLYNKIKSCNNRILRWYKRTEKEKELIIRLLDLIHEFKYIDELDKDLDKKVLKLKLSLTNDSFLFILNNLSKVTKYPLLKEYKEIENLKGYCGYIAPNGDLLTTNNIDMFYGNLDCLVSVDLYNLKIQNKITDNLFVTKGRGL